MTKEERERLRRKVVESLRTVHDPEIPVNVYDLGLVYGVDIDDEGNVRVEMTMTAPGCPMAGMVVKMTELALKEAIPNAKSIKVDLVWDPPWTPARVTQEGRKKLRELYGFDVVGEWEKRARGEI